MVGNPSTEKVSGYTLAQKIVGRACGLPEGKGVLPNVYCEPLMTTVGSQDTTGPMTRYVTSQSLALDYPSRILIITLFCLTAEMS